MLPLYTRTSRTGYSHRDLFLGTLRAYTNDGKLSGSTRSPRPHWLLHLLVLGWAVSKRN